jgi:hypothetical protein
MLTTKPVIRVETCISSMTAGIELLHECCFIFRYSGQLFEMVTYFPLTMRRLRAADVRMILEKHARWEKIDHCSWCGVWCECWHETRPPWLLCQFILECSEDWPFPELNAVPILSSRGARHGL